MTDLQTLQILLERVEGAEGADRELDAGIEVALLGARHTDGVGRVRWPNGSRQRAGHHTASLDAALALVEWVLPDLDPTVWRFWGRVRNGLPPWGARLEDRGATRAVHTYSPSAALALLAALLKALIAQGGERLVGGAGDE